MYVWVRFRSSSDLRQPFMHSIHLWRTNSSRLTATNLCRVNVHYVCKCTFISLLCMYKRCVWHAFVIGYVVYMYTFYSAPTPALQHDLEQCRHNDCVTILFIKSNSNPKSGTTVNLKTYSGQASSKQRSRQHSISQKLVC